jgi:hypothetical protein
MKRYKVQGSDLLEVAKLGNPGSTGGALSQDNTLIC